MGEPDMLSLFKNGSLDLFKGSCQPSADRGRLHKNDLLVLWNPAVDETSYATSETSESSISRSKAHPTLERTQEVTVGTKAHA
jgi:peptide deformylase